MKCSRCKTKFDRNDHFAMFYIRTTDGKSQSYPLCRKCVLGFTEFMKAGMPEETVQTEEDKPQRAEEPAYISNATEPKTAQEIVEAAAVCPIR